MPKKTRREKMIADTRNTPHTVGGNVYQFNRSSLPITPSFVSSTQMGELAQIKRDLAKTIFLASIALVVEFGLWWYWKT
ncbi:hypothetical protein HY948_01070 [Candidatus Gottesmanbacteria bacterium]|nr:hypothetical protein [Candidatus Gottesmanbacteria bacterium]